MGILFMLGFGLIWLGAGLGGLNLGWPTLGTVLLGYVGSAMAGATLLHRYREGPVAPRQPQVDWRRRFNRIGAL